MRTNLWICFVSSVGVIAGVIYAARMRGARSSYVVNSIAIGNPAMVTIDLNTRRIAYGKDYEPDRAAQLFWHEVSSRMPLCRVEASK